MEAVKQLGFDKVFEVEQAVDFVKEAYKDLEKKNCLILRLAHTALL